MLAADPINATVAMTFRFYNVASGGTALWVESWPGVMVTDGLFNALLGNATPLPQTMFTENTNLWLGIQVGTDNEMSPRVEVGRVPYAAQALAVPEGAITTSMLADEAVTSEKTALQHYSVELDFFQTSSTTFVDIPGSAITFTVNSTSTALLGFAGNMYTMMQIDGAAGELMTVSLDGNDRTDLVNQDLFAWSGNCCAPNAAISPAGFTTLLTVGPGTHVLKLRILSSSYNPVYRYAGIGYNDHSSTFSVVILGK